MKQHQTTFKKQLEKSGLNDYENWKGDPRERLISFLSPLTEKSNYYLKINTTDTTKKILELWREGDSRRKMGMQLHPVAQTPKAFFEPEFYSLLKTYLCLPENQREDKKQPHVIISLEQIWLIVYVATGILG